MIRRLLFLAFIVMAIGFIHRRRRRRQAADMPAPLAHPTTGTSTVGGDQTTTTTHLRPTAPTPRRDEPEKS